MSLVKEIILSLVSCLVVLIALSIGFYRFIPNNKVIPETVSYQASEEIKNEWCEPVSDECYGKLK